MAHSERILDSILFLFGVVRVGASWSSQNWGQQWAVISKNLSDSPWEGDHLSSSAKSSKEVSYILTKMLGAGNNDNIVIFLGSIYIVVEVVDNERITVARKMDIEFEEQGRDRRRRGVVSGESEEDVALGVYELEEIDWR